AEEFEKRIHFLGQISQEKLAEYLRDSQLFILPSFYEGFPKVLLESLACGCSAIITDLPGVRTCLENACGDSERVEFIPLPKMKSIEQPKKEVLPSFVENLKNAIKAHIQKQKTRQEQNYARKITKSFGWNALFNKYKDIYNEVLKGQSLM
ncbi:MAG: glycosyltransferase, partial [Promethearchaeia archaeon]